ncbi:hypothetical protein EC973_004109 [Apophysomyces ossiformis]|uniref:BZIP domain-containing protein n=1 Tax=Apophysomyces ossiformis TaxID=679940 RepID=A0A8H7ELY6_9FUNG|nr:hypothetical protein EC973_004109 [Apophysomyces ossiformis]
MPQQRQPSHQHTSAQGCPLPSLGQPVTHSPFTDLYRKDSRHTASSATLRSRPLSHRMRYVVFDVVDEPVKVHRRPGRIPNPAAMDARKEQNRVAQRAFRERKRRDFCKLQETIKALREEGDRLTKELQNLKAEHEILKTEKWYFRGTAISLHFLCLQKKIFIPVHMPYFALEQLRDIATTAPEAIQPYINACIKNNMSLDPTMQIYDPNALVELCSTIFKKDSPKESTSNGKMKPSIPEPQNVNEKATISCNSTEAREKKDEKQDHQQEKEQRQKAERRQEAEQEAEKERGREHKQETERQKEHEPEQREKEQLGKQNMSMSMSMTKPKLPTMGWIQCARMLIRTRAIFIGESFPKYVTQQTFLGSRVPHDIRISSIPTVARNRPIMYRDMIDVDQYMEELINKYTYLGGDPLYLSAWHIK